MGGRNFVPFNFAVFIKPAYFGFLRAAVKDGIYRLADIRMNGYSIAFLDFDNYVEGWWCLALQY
jgi:hypothetical protein